jgi:hypothetical protein
MSRKWAGHLVSLVLVSLILISLVFYFNKKQKKIQQNQSAIVEKWLNLDYLNFDEPLHKSILEESLNLFDPQARQEHAAQISMIDDYRNSQLLNAIKKQDRSGALTKEQLWDLAGMYLKFILVYLITLILTFYGVQTFGTYRFVREKQDRNPYWQDIIKIFSKKPAQLNLKTTWLIYSPGLLLIIKSILKAIAYMVLFSPAYVLAYSFRTRFDTDTILFMILLGVISNALLITYTQKFYTFLIGESRKGYVETAIVKNMQNSYHFGGKGILRAKIFYWKKNFSGHVFDHIYENAHFQYLPAIKEQASFLITGLIIIEMALNIQNHLCYELLQNILYENYAIVTLIVLGIYYIVKATNMAVDWFTEIASRRFYNLA